MSESAVKHNNMALSLVWLVPALWTVNYIIGRKAPGIIGPYALAMGRWACAALVLLALAGGELWQQRRSVVQVWWQYLALGACGMLVCGAWVYQGARSTSTMNMALIYAASPVLIAIGSVLWLGERMAWRQMLGAALALGGVLQVVLKGHWLALTTVQFVPGDLWMVAATTAWAGYALLQKAWPSQLSATARLAAICLGGVVALLPFTVAEIGLQHLTQWGLPALQLVLIAALVPGLMAYWIYGWAQKMLGASKVAVALYLGPLYTALASWGWMGERLGLYHLVGALMILPGVFLVTRAGAK